MNNNNVINKVISGLALGAVVFCANVSFAYATEVKGEHGHEHEKHDDHQQPPAVGCHGGKVLKDGNVAVELSILGEGDSPQYRAWISRDGKPLNNKNLQLSVETTRLEGEVKNFKLQQQNGYWSAANAVLEPHSFDVKVRLTMEGQAHSWQFASYEGRSEISSDIARQSGITTAIADAGEIKRSLTVYGKAVADSGRVSHIRARFPGTIVRVKANLGDQVKKGDVLAQVESNESLKRYSLLAPFAGVVTARHATPGEATADQALFTVANFDQVWAEFQIFPGQVRRVTIAQPVTISVESELTESTIKHLIPSDSGKPFVLARAPINNTGGEWTPGLLLVGKVVVDQFEAPLVVDNRAIQSMGKNKVVFIKVANSYEARPLKLGRSDSRFTEVLNGLAVGDEYVVENSYLIKADIEKSGASHQH